MLPEKFLSSIKNVQGLDIKSFEATHLAQEQITSIRKNPFKNTTVFSEKNNEQVPWCKHGIYLSERPSFTLDPNFHAGTYYVQEASSMFLWHIVQQIFGDDTQKKILDTCAAPGGKSTLLASYFFDGLVVSNEVIKQRANILAENITKWGTTNCIVTNNDPKQFAPIKNYFDAVLIDAPCSGSGMFRKDITAIEEWSLENVSLCSQRQQRIIADIWPSIQENGFLIYSTCSYAAEENEDILDWIYNNFSVESIKIKVPDSWHIVTSQSNQHKAFGYRFYPDKIKGEGFFIAVMQKKESAGKTKFKLNNFQLPTKQEQAFLQELVQLPNTLTLFKHHNEIKTIQANFLQDVAILSQYLYIKKAGTIIGELKGKNFVPHHELAVSILRLSNIATLELSLDEALQYLRKKEINTTTNHKGMVLVTYFGVGLGWIKVLDNRINNYYPSEWRILKN